MPRLELFQILDSTWTRILFVGIALACVVLAIFSYATTTRPIPTRRRWLLIGLRLVAVLAALLCLFRPVVVSTSEIVERDALLIVLDTSASMEIVGDTESKKYGVTAGRSRWHLLKVILDKHRDTLERLAEKYDITFALFAADQQELLAGTDLERSKIVKEALLRLPVTAQGAETNLGKQAARTSAFQRVLLLSDGRVTSGITDPDEIVHRFGTDTRVYTVAFGKEIAPEQLRDIRAEKMKITGSDKNGNTVSLHTTVAIEAGFQFLGGLPKEPVNLRLLIKKPKGDYEVVARQRAGERSKTFAFQHRFDTPGIHWVRIESDRFDWELDQDNNYVEKPIRVVKKTITVRYIEGFRWEAKYLAAQLGNWAKADFLMLSGLTTGNLNASLPESKEEWDAIDVFIIGNVNRNALGDAAAEWIRDRVEAGAGLLMLGGRHNFGPGGYAGSELAKVLPVKIANGDRQEDQAVKLRLTQQGRADFLTRLLPDANKNADAWNFLPATPGLTRVQGPKDGTSTLLETEDGEPILVAGEYGAGRTAAMLTQGTRAWAFNDLSDEDFARTKLYHKTFWRQMVLWLANREHIKKVGVDLSVLEASPPFDVGQEVDFKVQVNDEKSKPISGLTVTVEVFDKNDSPDTLAETLPAPFRGTGRFYKARLRTRKQGDYRIVATAKTPDGKLVGKDEIEINVRQSGLEIENPAADFDTLRRIAGKTNGAFRTAEKFEEILDILRRADNITQPKSKEQVHSIWDRAGIPLYLILFIFCSALGAEWFLRKRSGLV